MVPSIHICCDDMYVGPGDAALSRSFVLCIWNVSVYELLFTLLQAMRHTAKEYQIHCGVQGGRCFVNERQRKAIPSIEPKTGGVVVVDMSHGGLTLVDVAMATWSMRLQAGSLQASFGGTTARRSIGSPFHFTTVQLMFMQ